MQRRTFITSLAAVAGLTATGVPAAADHTENRSELDLETDDGSHHPGPPRFTHKGRGFVNPNFDEENIRDDLAPRNPDGDAEYSWSVVDAPADSSATPTDAAVAEFEPDVPGEYTLELDAPDGTHELTVRVFPEEDEDDPRPRVDLDAEVVEGQVLLSANAMAPDREDVIDEQVDVEFYVDDRDKDVLAGNGTISASEITDPVRVHAVAVGDRHSVADMIKLVPEGDDLHVEHPYKAPDWVENSIIYSIFTRRFPEQELDGETIATDDTPGFDEIAGRLDHLDELGVDVLWMTPFVPTDRGFGTPEAEGGPHGYHKTDYFDVDPDLGTMEDFENLVDEAHDRDIKVVFDLVINHASENHPFFQAALDESHEEHEKYYDWFRWDDDGNREAYYGWDGIPNLDHENPEVREWCLDVVDFWAPKVDGFRADIAWGVPNHFWKEIYQRVTEYDSDFFMLDETLPYDEEFGAGGFDVHYDNHLHGALGAAAEGTAEEVLEAYEDRFRNGAHPESLFMQYIENHDTDRYLEQHGFMAQLAAGTATFTLPGVPMIYYGQETGLTDWREPMNWGDFDENTLEFYQQLVDLRKSHPALQHHARVERIDYEADSDSTLAYARYDPETDRRVVVLLDFSDDTQTVRIGDYVESENLITGDDAGLEVNEEHEYVEIDVPTGIVLEADEPTDFSLPGNVIAEFEQPEGTDFGPGNYTYPGTEEIPEGEFDLAGVTIEETDETFRFEFEFHNEVSNPWDNDSGVSHQHIQVYLNDPEVDDGETEARTGVNAELAAPYQHVLTAGPGEHTVYDADGDIVGEEGDYSYDPDEDPNTIVVEFDKHAIDYLPEAGMAVIVMSYDGYGDGGVRAVESEASEWQFGGAEHGTAPNVIDLLTAEDVDNEDALAYDEDNYAQIPYVALGDEEIDEEDGEEEDDDADDEDDGLPGFGVAAGAAGVAGGAVYAANRVLGADENTEE
ncbi:alpha-amylase family glycosyl hydrolase [Natranaeroarchaeum sulfidigenes]|uniref:Glycosidase n=1 Tax=Natranaeroarchaeum sulfidigenes TaxID=2784880 RepID=A0A897MV99_9EURY|nr:alpha-amylase family glycosyl hydrolase [Natranaeroarchaeum sulfidigenes]QSG02086.1 Glycosidase [Natranaeroarchaeum sulfidigenes]